MPRSDIHVACRATFPTRPDWMFDVVREFQVLAGQISSIPPVAIGEAITHLLQSLPQPSSRMEELVLLGLAADARRHAVQSVPSRSGDLTAAGAVATRAKQIIEKGFASRMTYRTLGRELACDPEYLEQLFRAATGTTLHEYLLGTRLKRAIDMIRAGDKIEAVAMAVGFKTPLCQ